MTYAASDRSFVFRNNTDHVIKEDPTGFPTGDAIYSMSAWIWMDGNQYGPGQSGYFSQIITFGSAWSSQTLASMYIEGGPNGHLATDIGSNTCKTTNAVISDKTWHHVAIVKKGTGQISTSMFDMYVDGVAITDKTASGSGTQNMGTITGFSVGMAFNGTGQTGINYDQLYGKISKPKVWNIALAADDIAADYALGRTGKDLNITDTSVCIGGTAPTAKLDVRGDLNFTGLLLQNGLPRLQNWTPSGSDIYRSSGNIGIGTNSPDCLLHLRPNTNLSAYSAQQAIDRATVRIQANNVTTYNGNASQSGVSLYMGHTSMNQPPYDGFYMQAQGPGNGGGIQAYPINLNPFYGGVGIGTYSPRTTLHVNGTMGANFDSYGYTSNYWRFDSSTTLAGSNWNHTSAAGGAYSSIYASGGIVSGNYFVSTTGVFTSSDERIKKNIVDVDDTECLDTLRLLKPKKYEYKDPIKQGEEPVWGFIAQEVKDTLPYATELKHDVLPNICELANVSSSNVITFTNFNTANLLTSNVTTRIRSMGHGGIENDFHLVEVIDAHTIRVKEDLDEFTSSLDAEGNVISEITTTTITHTEYEALEDKTGFNKNDDDTYTKTNKTHPGNQLFIYGQEVDDFVILKKDAIWTVATAALQEVDRQLQAEKAKVADLLARVTALENA
jgi:hypothetical protein